MQCNNQLCLLIVLTKVHIMPPFLLSTRVPRQRPGIRCREGHYSSPPQDSKRQVRCRQGRTRPSRQTSQPNRPGRQTCQADGQANQPGQADMTIKQTCQANNRCSTNFTPTAIWIGPAHKTVPSMQSQRSSWKPVPRQGPDISCGRPRYQMWRRSLRLSTRKRQAMA